MSAQPIDPAYSALFDEFITMPGEEEKKKKRKRYKNFSKDEDEQIVALRKQGLSMKDVAMKLGDRDDKSIQYRWLKLKSAAKQEFFDTIDPSADQEGVEKEAKALRRSQRYTAEEDAKIKELRAKDMSYREIAKQIPERTKHSISNRCRDLGVAVGSREMARYSKRRKQGDESQPTLH